MAVIIPHVTNWSVTPQNGQEDYFTKMNIWLSESTSVIATLNTAITKINESNTESNSNLNQVLTARNQTVAARNEAVTAVATLTAGAIDDTTIAANKAFSNQYTNNNFVKLTEKQTINGVKTFTSNPIVPTPTNDYHSSTKKYVDDKTTINSFVDKLAPFDVDNFALQEPSGLFKKLSFGDLKYWIRSFSFGWDQTWQDVTASRSLGVTYTNDTSKPIFVSVQLDATVSNSTFTIKVNNKVVNNVTISNVSGDSSVVAVVPVSSTYKVEQSYLTGGTVTYWLELR